MDSANDRCRKTVTSQRARIKALENENKKLVKDNRDLGLESVELKSENKELKGLPVFDPKGPVDFPEGQLGESCEPCPDCGTELIYGHPHLCNSQLG